MIFASGVSSKEVLFRVGFGRGDALKRLIEDADNPLLFGEGRIADMKRLNLREIDCLMNRTA